MDNLRNLAMKYDADGKEISGIADSGAMMTPVPEGSAAGETMMTPVSVDGAGVTEVTMTLLPDGGTADMNAEDTAAEPVYTGVMARGRKQEEFEEGGRAPFAYLEEEQNLNFPAFSAETVDEDAPLTSFQIAGKWLRQAADLRNYWALLENFGAQAAEYKWAYDEGKFGTFEAGAFGRELLKAGARGLGANTLRTAGNVLSMFGANLESRNAGTAAVTAGAGLLVPETGKIFKHRRQTGRICRQNRKFGITGTGSGSLQCRSELVETGKCSGTGIVTGSGNGNHGQIYRLGADLRFVCRGRRRRNL